ncbi:hypothetical protein G7048_03885 [Diaphorobacter sp. HDW4B]|nr:hypothetical protein G7048_03885 [Diaphorobacter sp. HDW4B]
MEQLRLKITGTAPLLMHADTLANPLSVAAKAHKELTAKRKKTDADHLDIARSEFLAGCYWSAEDGIYVPGQNFDAAFCAGAKLQKLGTHWKRGAFVLEDRVKLLHDGPDTPDALWNEPAFVDCRGVKVGQAKVMRYRPIFLNWAAEVMLTINPEVLSVREAQKAVSDAGALIGVGTYRPRFGRFEVNYV